MAEAMDVFDRSGHHFIHEEFQSIVSELKTSGLQKNLIEGKRLHAHIMKRGLHKNLLLCNHVLHMYVQCGSVTDVQDCFSNMDQKNKFSWNFLITAYAKEGLLNNALHAFYQMENEGFIPNEFIYASVISSCTRNASLLPGKRIHNQLIDSGLEANTAVCNALLDMYVKCDSIEEASRIFYLMKDRNVVSWTGMISAHLQSECWIALYSQMQQEGIMPNRVTFITILEACALNKCVSQGKPVHVWAIGSGLESELVLGTALVNMYGKCGNLHDAVEMFKHIADRNIVLWTTMITAFSQQGYANEAVKVFKRMVEEGILPDNVTYGSILDACACEAGLAMGKQTHMALLLCPELQSNIILETALVNMYGKSGAVHEALHVFNMMEHCPLFAWTALITSYVYHGDNDEAIKLFGQMENEGIVPDKAILLCVIDACATIADSCEGMHLHKIITSIGHEMDLLISTGLINMYGKCGRIDEAEYVLNRTSEPDIVSLTAMITAYAKHGHCREALLLYDEMQVKGFSPNRVTYIAILSAFSGESDLAEGKKLHASISKSEFRQDVVVMTALVNMYGKCGSLEDAHQTFDEMIERNVISWNTMIASYVNCGCCIKALELFDSMLQKQVLPNKATFVSVLDACATLACLHEGETTHVLAVHRGFDVDIDVGNSILNMYGKTGDLQDANLIFEGMLERDAYTWNIIIGAFSQHGDAKKVLELLEEMLSKECSLDEFTNVNVLSACGNSGLVVEGWHYSILLFDNRNIVPMTEHYHCIVHMLARSGLMEEAEIFISSMPLQPSSVTWTVLLSSCRISPDIYRGERIVKHIKELDDENSTPYIMISQVYGICRAVE